MSAKIALAPKANTRYDCLWLPCATASGELGAARLRTTKVPALRETQSRSRKNRGRSAVIESLTLSSVAAAIIGGILGRQSGGNWAAGGARQVILVLLAAGVTYGIGLALQHAGAFTR